MTADQARSITNQGVTNSRLSEIYQTIRTEASRSTSEKRVTSIVTPLAGPEEIQVLRNGGFTVEPWEQCGMEWTKVSWEKYVSSECDYFTEAHKEFLAQPSRTSCSTKEEDIEKEYKTVSEDSKRVEKTIREWFMELPTGLREKAIANIDISDSDSRVASLADAVHGGFAWANTTEGSCFWKDIYLKLNDGESLTEEYLKSINV